MQPEIGSKLHLENANSKRPMQKLRDDLSPTSRASQDLPFYEVPLSKTNQLVKY